jgi:hypothetical protein
LSVRSSASDAALERRSWNIVHACPRSSLHCMALMLWLNLVI